MKFNIVSLIVVLTVLVAGVALAEKPAETAAYGGYCPVVHLRFICRPLVFLALRARYADQKHQSQCTAAPANQVIESRQAPAMDIPSEP